MLNVRGKALPRGNFRSKFYYYCNNYCASAFWVRNRNNAVMTSWTICCSKHSKGSFYNSSRGSESKILCNVTKMLGSLSSWRKFMFVFRECKTSSIDVHFRRLSSKARRSVTAPNEWNTEWTSRSHDEIINSILDREFIADISKLCNMLQEFTTSNSFYTTRMNVSFPRASLLIRSNTFWNERHIARNASPCPNRSNQRGSRGPHTRPIQLQWKDHEQIRNGRLLDISDPMS